MRWMECKIPILSGSKCRFLLAKLQIDHILSPRSPLDQLKRLKTIPTDLFEAYDRVIERIKGSGQEGDTDLSMIIISWIYHAQRILTMDELLEAVVIEQYCQDANPELSIEELDTILECKITPIDVVDSCKGLVLFEESSRSVRFTHETVKEFIKKRNLKLLSPGRLAKICLIYLGSHPFDTPCPDETSLLARMETYKLNRYAAQYWHGHIRASGIEEPELLKSSLVRRLFDSTSTELLYELAGRISSRAGTSHDRRLSGLGTTCPQYAIHRSWACSMLRNGFWIRERTSMRKEDVRQRLASCIMERSRSGGSIAAGEGSECQCRGRTLRQCSASCITERSQSGGWITAGEGSGRQCGGRTIRQCSASCIIEWSRSGGSIAAGEGSERQCRGRTLWQCSASCIIEWSRSDGSIAAGEGSERQCRGRTIWQCSASCIIEWSRSGGSIAAGEGSERQCRGRRLWQRSASCIIEWPRSGGSIAAGEGSERQCRGRTLRQMLCKLHRRMVTKRWFDCCWRRERTSMQREDTMAMLCKLHRTMAMKRWFDCCWRRERTSMQREDNTAVLCKLHYGTSRIGGSIRRWLNYCWRRERTSV